MGLIARTVYMLQLCSLNDGSPTLLRGNWYGSSVRITGMPAYIALGKDWLSDVDTMENDYLHIRENNPKLLSTPPLRLVRITNWGAFGHLNAPMNDAISLKDNLGFITSSVRRHIQ